MSVVERYDDYLREAAAREEAERAEVRHQAKDSYEHIMQFFAYSHLAPEKQAVSKLFADLAVEVLLLPRNPERTVALRKLLEAKDAAVRASFAKDAPR